MLAICYCRVLAILIFASASGTFAGCMYKANLSLADKLTAGLNCIDDSASCLAKRRQALDAIIADQTNEWIDKPATANSDASGVRLFAFRLKKKDLTCRQLRLGYKEAKSARSRLKTAESPQLTPALVSRGAMFADEVALELNREIKMRDC